tara:strand:- start:42 stop:224 length:183 start_codon:yes stop_codon:yes gene_type:complete
MKASFLIYSFALWNGKSYFMLISRNTQNGGKIALKQGQTLAPNARKNKKRGYGLNRNPLF